MKRMKIRVLFLVFLTLQATQLFADGSIVSSTTSGWLYLSLALFLAAVGVAFVLRKKQKQNVLRLEKLQNSLKTLQQELTSLKENREEIIQQRIKSLHDELESRKQNLEAMKKTLEASKRSANQNSFLLTKISHTLRTNLNDILGFSLLLGNEFALNEEQELFEFNENIRKSGASLMHLLNNIIDISKIESKSFYLHTEECHLADISHKLISQYEPAAGQKDIKIVFQDNKVPPFAADSEAVKHILSNLLDNAVRYTEKGFIKISQTLQDNEVVWTIKDTGTGIDKAYLSDIFEPFRQQSLGYSKTNYQGAGLGLPLIKSMLDIMGGRIDIHSEKAKGTTVTIYLPFKPFTAKNIQPDAKKAIVPNDKKLGSKKSELKKANAKILILDEDRLGNMLIKKILSSTQVEAYNKGVNPYKWIAQRLEKQPKPDILMIEMDFTGKRKATVVLQKIKEMHPEIENTPAIVLSAYPDTNGSEKAIQQGFDAYLQKPFHKNDLIFLLNRLITS